MKYNQWLQKWLELYVKPVAKPQTYIKYESAVRLHISPALGSYDIDQLKADILQRFVVDMADSLSASTVNCIITVMQKSLQCAVTLGITQTQYADKVIRPKVQGKKVECFTVAQQRKIEKAVFESNKPKLFGVVLCLYTGLRLGELLALQWKDIDFKKGILQVNKSCRWANINGVYSPIIEPPKTAQSIREIPIPKQLLPHIKGLMKLSNSDFVISDNGKPVHTRSYQKLFELLLKRLKIPHKGFHALRHTFATRAIECGMDIKTLSEILGHKNAEITLNRYAHSLLEHKTEMMNKLGKMLSD